MKDCGADVRRCPKQSALRMFLKAETTGSGNQFDLKKISIKQFKTRAAKAAWTEVVKKARKDRNPGKQAFSLPYISHNVHYTKCTQSKKQVSSLFHFQVRRPVCECIVWNRIVLPVHLFLFNSGKVRPAVQTAAVCQSIHRSPHNKCVPLFYSLLRCRIVLHRLHSLQSTVLPIQPDSSRLLTM